MNTKLIVAGASLFVASLVGFGIYLAFKPYKSPPRTVPLSAEYQQHLKDGFWARGSTAPKVVVTEYADFQCPLCFRLEPAMAGALTQTADIAQIQFRHYPIEQLHDKADKAAIASEAAGRQGKFWQMHDLLYSQWSNWKDQSPSSFDGTVTDFAKKIGLDATQFANDLEEPNIFDLVAQNKVSGNGSQLTGTPLVLLNGTELKGPGLTADLLAAQIKAAAK